MSATPSPSSSPRRTSRPPTRPRPSRSTIASLPAVDLAVDAAVKSGAPLVYDTVAGNLCYDWEIGDKAAVDAAFAKAAHVTKLDLVNNRLVAQRDGAARLYRRLRARHRRIHALHHVPEPARDPAADGRLRAAAAGAQAARRRARRRRRLRLEDLSTTPRRRRSPGPRASSAGRSSGWPSAARASCRTRRAAIT